MWGWVRAPGSVGTLVGLIMQLEGTLGQWDKSLLYLIIPFINGISLTPPPTFHSDWRQLRFTLLCLV